MDSHKYRLDVRWSAEDECCVVTVPELLGCTAHGDTHAEAVEEAQTAIQLWLETAEEMGRAIPEPLAEREFSGRILLRLPADLHRQLTYEAAGQGVSLNQYMLWKLEMKPPAHRRPLQLSLAWTALDDELADKVLTYLKGHARGKQSAKTTDQIARAVGMQVTRENTQLRTLIRKLVMSGSAPIIGTSSGYFYAQAIDEIKSAVKSLERRMESIRDRLEHLRAAAHVAEKVEELEGLQDHLAAEAEQAEIFSKYERLLQVQVAGGSR